MVSVDGTNVPLAAHLLPPNPAQVQLGEPTPVQVVVPRGAGRPGQKPAPPVADGAYEPSELWAWHSQRGMELIAPHLSSRRHCFQEGRKQRRYRRRCSIERTMSWLLSSRRLTARYEHHLELENALVLIACMMTTLREL